MNTKSLLHILVGGFILTAAFSGCRGTISEKPPIHPNPNMDNIDLFEAQESNTFFVDKRAMRLPVEGTVARGHLNEDSRLYDGKDERGRFVAKIPVSVDKAFILRGKKQFNIYCTPCHGGVGYGDGSVVEFGLVKPTSYHIDRLRDVEDGYLYDVIKNGIRTMYPYASQIPDVEDRWAIVAYIRALQKSQNATLSDVGEDNLKNLK